MKKDAYYFPHFCNARSDRKIKRVLKDLGIEGYGIYFMLLEVLREQDGFKYPLSDIDLLADEFGTSESKVSVVISKYDLFQVDSKENFFSIKQIYYLQPYIEKSERAREAANKRWNNANASTNALQIESKSSADAMQVKESKPNQSEEKKSEGVEPPPSEMILDLYIEQDLLSCAKGYFLHTNFQRAIEILLMDYAVKEKTVNELKHTALEFNKHCALEGKVKRSLTEWGKHFKNWLIDPKRIYAASTGTQSAKEIEKFNRTIFDQ